MTTKRIIFTRTDGGVSVVNPSDNFILEFDGTEEKALDEIKSRAIPIDATDIEIVEASEIPSDRTFRNAWVRPAGGGPITVDMAKARDIHAERLAVAEQAKARSEDKESRRQQVRGRLNSAQTPEALKAITE